ncbi:MAG: cytochrome b/b6 domain-containing protein [Roseitalea porphyridii]|uniref:cytochrome b/b6 domain-containing protein n=1 Tax=Hyphomicrobiales TaxID=356 RepID=UPI0032EF899B
MSTDAMDTGAEEAEAYADRPSGPPHSAERRPLPADRFGGYSPLSIGLHWLGFLLIAALAATFWLERLDLHLLVGIIAAPVLLVHAVRRFARGFPRAPDEPAPAALIARLAIVVMLVAMIMLALTGLAMPLAAGLPATVLGVALPVPPWPPQPAIAATAASVHAGAAIALAGGLGVHLLAAVGYGARGMHAVTGRVVRPVRHGR